MANTTQDTLYDTFLALASELGQTSPPMIEASQQLENSAATVSKAMDSVGTTWDRITPIAASLTSGAATGTATASGASAGSVVSTVLSSVSGTIPLAGTLTNSGSGGGSSSTIETIASTVLKSGFGLIPLVGSLLGLFGGGGSDTPPPLVKYALPPSLQFQAGQSDWGVGNSDYDQMGMPRSYAPSPAGASGADTGSGAPAGGTAQITVNVNAMDARSFLDRSSDIAAAVREAMLNLNPINDVVNDL
jgi:hypothetical protein